MMCGSNVFNLNECLGLLFAFLAGNFTNDSSTFKSYSEREMKRDRKRKRKSARYMEKEIQISNHIKICAFVAQKLFHDSITGFGGLKPHTNTYIQRHMIITLTHQPDLIYSLNACSNNSKCLVKLAMRVCFSCLFIMQATQRRRGSSCVSLIDFSPFYPYTHTGNHS